MRRIDVKTYLQKRQGQIKAGTDIIRDHAVFDFNYIPDHPLLREEAKTIIDAILLYAHTGIPKNLAIIGSRGSGKTLMIKYIAKELQRETSQAMLYCNIRNHNTSYKALMHMLGIQRRGGALDELFSMFRARYSTRTVIILDEIDLMSPKDKNMEILYRLSRSSGNYMTILLSNNPRVLRSLDESTRSTLQPQVIYFRNYDAKQIYTILKGRARQGLKNYNREILARIAALTTRNTNSDVRVAIKSLFYTATEPSLSVDAAMERAGKDVITDVIQDLNDKCLLILESARRSRSRLAKDIYQQYKKLSEEHGETPFSYMHFCNNLSYLQSNGLILLASTKVGRTYMNRIRILFDQEAEAETFRNRLN